jgi:hypothetical protein
LSSNSKRTSRKFDIRRVNVALDILARSSAGNAALVSLHPSAVTNHFVSVYLCDQLSPLLGDHMYSYRVKSMMGTPVKVGHQNSPINPVQVRPGLIQWDSYSTPVPASPGLDAPQPRASEGKRSAGAQAPAPAEDNLAELFRH